MSYVFKILKANLVYVFTYFHRKVIYLFIFGEGIGQLIFHIAKVELVSILLFATASAGPLILLNISTY